MSIRLTTEQFDSVQRAAAPLAPDRRPAFISDVTTALQSVPVIGDGVLHRCIVEIQRQHFDPPRFADALSKPHHR